MARVLHPSIQLAEVHVQHRSIRNTLVLLLQTLRQTLRSRLGNGSGVFPRLLPARLVPRSLEGIPPVMHRCRRSLLSKPPTEFFRLFSSTPTLVVDSAKPLPRPNALTLIHKTSALLPSTLSPTPKHPVESLKLWTDLLDYAHNASVTHGGSAGSGNRKARIVGTFTALVLSTLHFLTPNFPFSVQSTERTRTRAHLIS